MKNDKIIPGIVLVVIGAVILLANYGYLHFHFVNIIRLWPIFLVIGGVNLVFAHNKTPLATIIKISIVVLGIGVVLFGNFGERYNFWPGWRYHNNNNNNNNDFDDDDDNNDSGTAVMAVNGAFTVPFNSSTQSAKLNINGGAIGFKLSDTTNQLFNALTPKGDANRYAFSQSTDDGVPVLTFKTKNHDGFNFDSDKNKAEFRLNTKPQWDIDVETGASAIDFDLSKFKVKSLGLHGGAASFDVKLGQPLEMTDVEVETGVSSVNIRIPSNAACSIETDSGLSDNSFQGFTKTDDNTYETPGYSTAKNKMHIHISGGLSGFNVNRY